MLKKDEFIASLQQNNFLDFWLQFDKEEIELKLGKEAANMYGFDQRNPHHCYDLFEHCLRTVQGVKIEDTEDKLLRCAALLHDVAKPLVAKEKDGRLVFYGHAAMSAQIAKPILEKMGFSSSEVDFMVFCIYHHDDFINYTDMPDAEVSGKVLIADATLKRYIKRLLKRETVLDEISVLHFIKKLLKLCKADAAAQSQEVYFHGQLVDSRQNKLRKLNKIEAALFD